MKFLTISIICYMGAFSVFASPQQKAEGHFRNLLALLSEPGAIRMPKVARRNAANEMTAQVAQAEVAGESQLPKLVEQEVKALLDDYHLPSRSIWDLATGQVNVSFATGHNDRTLKEDILDMIGEERKGPVSSLLDELQATFVRYSFYDKNSGIYGGEILIIKSMWLSKAVVIRITYVHA